MEHSGIEIARFYGFGNETPQDSGLASRGFYDVRQDQIIVNPLIEVPVFGLPRGRAVPCSSVSSVDQSGLIGQVRPADSGGMTLASGEAGLAFAHDNGAVAY